MTRCAAARRVFFIEEPIFDAAPLPRLHLEASDGVTVELLEDRRRYGDGNRGMVRLDNDKCRHQIKLH